MSLTYATPDSMVPAIPSISAMFDLASRELAARQKIITLLDAYYTGAHPMPPMPDGANTEFQRLQAMCRANYCKLVANTTASGLRIKGLRLGDDAQAGIDAWNTYWDPNKMSRTQGQVWKRALSCMWSYLLVSPHDNPTHPACITVESPRQMIVLYEPGSTTRRMCALKQFRDAQYLYQVLWTADAVFYRKSPMTDAASWLASQGSYVDASDIAIWQPYYVGPSVFTFGVLGGNSSTAGYGAGPNPMTDGLVNPWGVVPVVEFAANANDEGVPESDFAAAIPAQDRINQNLIHRVFTQENQSWQHRVLIGEPKAYDPVTGQELNPVKAGPDRVTVLTNEKATIDAWQAAELSPFLASNQADIQEIAVLTRTPPNATIAALVNVGAEALHTLHEAHSLKLIDYQGTFADAMEETLAICMLGSGITGALDQDIEVIWADPDEPSLPERATAASQVGPYIAKRTLYSTFLGMSPIEVEQAIADSEAEDKAAMELAAAPTVDPITGAIIAPGAVAPSPSPAGPSPAGPTPKGVTQPPAKAKAPAKAPAK